MIPPYDSFYDDLYDPRYDSLHPLFDITEGLIPETEDSEGLNLTGERDNVLARQQEDSATFAEREEKKRRERPVTEEGEREYKKQRIENSLDPTLSRTNVIPPYLPRQPVYPVSPVPNANALPSYLPTPPAYSVLPAPHALPSYLPTPPVYSVPPVTNAIPSYLPRQPVYPVPPMPNAMPTHLQIAPWQSPPAYPMPPAILPNLVTSSGQFTSLPRALTLEELMAPPTQELILEPPELQFLKELIGLAKRGGATCKDLQYAKLIQKKLQAQLRVITKKEAMKISLLAQFVSAFSSTEIIRRLSPLVKIPRNTPRRGRELVKEIMRENGLLQLDIGLEINRQGRADGASCVHVFFKKRRKEGTKNTYFKIVASVVQPYFDGPLEELKELLKYD